MQRRTRLSRAKGLARAGKLQPAPLRLVTPLRAKPRPPLTDEQLRRALVRRWSEHARNKPCAVCGARYKPGVVAIQGHHIVPLQVLKREGVDVRGQFDLRNALALCAEPAPRRCHQRFELGMLSIPLTVVRAKAPKAEQFAREHGLSVQLERRYT